MIIFAEDVMLLLAEKDRNDTAMEMLDNMWLKEYWSRHADIPRAAYYQYLERIMRPVWKFKERWERKRAFRRLLKKYPKARKGTL